jgi:hypothetical protein
MFFYNIIKNKHPRKHVFIIQQIIRPNPIFRFSFIWLKKLSFYLFIPELLEIPIWIQLWSCFSCSMTWTFFQDNKYENAMFCNLCLYVDFGKSEKFICDWVGEWVKNEVSKFSECKRVFWSHSWFLGWLRCWTCMISKLLKKIKKE